MPKNMQKLRDLVRQGLFNLDLLTLAKNLAAKGVLKDNEKTRALLEVAEEVDKGVISVKKDHD
jgi:hypothetical protein